MTSSTAQTREYVYDALQPEERQIRLVTLLAGSEGVIYTKLSIVSLEVKPCFGALSYVWGEPTTTTPIMLEGHIFQATESLVVALHQLRLPDVDRVLWIDAICIDQIDVHERNSQVLLMREIYSRCLKCNVWLGKEDESTQAAIEFLHWLTEDKHIWEWKGFATLTQDSSENQQIPDLDSYVRFSVQNPQLFSPFNSLVRRSWWTRTWTVQELTLPHTVELLCGPFVISWNLFQESIRCIVSHGSHNSKCCYDFYLKNYVQGQHIFDETRFRLRVVQDLRATQVSGAKVDALALLDNFHNRRASDPRDKVYGILGLLSTTNIVPDHNLDVRTAYMQPVL